MIPQPSVCVSGHVAPFSNICASFSLVHSSVLCKVARPAVKCFCKNVAVIQCEGLLLISESFLYL